MDFRLSRNITRRGGITALTLISLGTMLTLVGVEANLGMYFVARQRVDMVAEALTMSAAQKLPNTEAATTAAATIARLYRTEEEPAFTSALVFTPATGTVVSVKATVTRPLTSLFGSLVPAARASVTGSATANRVIPSALLQGVVPLGVQYDVDFNLPPDGSAGGEPIVLKYGSATRKKKSQAYALDLPAIKWSDCLKYGYTGPVAVGDVVLTESGDRTGQVRQAFVTDTDSRLERARAEPYVSDTWESFQPGNPRVVVCPLVDWKDGNGGKDTVVVKGFAAFWIDTYQKGGGLEGRFVRYTVTGDGGAGWDGISIDPKGSADFDGGFWSVRRVN